jgi:hypothetical protein
VESAYIKSVKFIVGTGDITQYLKQYIDEMFAFATSPFAQIMVLHTYPYE